MKLIGQLIKKLETNHIIIDSINPFQFTLTWANT